MHISPMNADLTPPTPPFWLILQVVSEPPKSWWFLHQKFNLQSNLRSTLTGNADLISRPSDVFPSPPGLTIVSAVSAKEAQELVLVSVQESHLSVHLVHVLAVFVPRFWNKILTKPALQVSSILPKVGYHADLASGSFVTQIGLFWRSIIDAFQWISTSFIDLPIDGNLIFPIDFSTSKEVQKWTQNEVQNEPKKDLKMSQKEVIYWPKSGLFLASFWATFRPHFGSKKEPKIRPLKRSKKRHFIGLKNVTFWPPKWAKKRPKKGPKMGQKVAHFGTEIVTFWATFWPLFGPENGSFLALFWTLKMMFL